MKLIRHLAAKNHHTDDEGAALPLVAGMLVVLLGLSAFAVDMGWLYLNAHQLQRAADSAALAGVVHLPGFPSRVTEDTNAGAAANGFSPAEDTNDLSWQALEDNRLEVTLSTSVPSFFLRVLGFDNFDIVRRATAEYIKPVPIGSPFNSFGDGNDSDQGFWAAISGPYTARANGDAFQSKCDWSYELGECMASSEENAENWGDDPGPFPGHNPNIYPNDIVGDGIAENSDYRPEGYFYGIEVASGTSRVDVDLYDPAFRRRSDFHTGTGDNDRLVWGPPGSGLKGPHTHFQLYAPDDTPLDPTDNTPISGCREDYAPRNSAPNPPGYNTWTELCSISDPTPGIYVLRVWTSAGTGSNHYAVRAQTNGPNARVFGINDISIFANADNAILHLAEIDPIHKGKRLQLRFFDPGEGDDDAYMTVLLPDNSTALCTWEARTLAGAVIGSQSSTGPCRILTTDDGENLYNNVWLNVNIDIPSGYDCDIESETGCWWKMHMELNRPHDRTTWTANVIGNPIRLVGNE